MKRKRRSTAVEITMLVIRDYIAGRNLRSGDELPPIKSLAKAAGVSFVTAWKAVAELKRQGLLTGVSGHPPRVAQIAAGSSAQPEDGAVLPPAALAVRSTAWRRLREELAHDILDGKLPPGKPLPSLKELGRRYPASYGTLRKALDSLQAEGSLERAGSGYSVPMFPSPAHRSRIIYLTHSFDSFSMYLGQHDETIFRTLERECATARISLDVFLGSFEWLDGVRGNGTPGPGPRPWRNIIRQMRTGRIIRIEDLVTLDDPVVLGFILIVPGEPRELEHQLLRAFVEAGKPAAILDQAAIWSLPRTYENSRNVRKFTISASCEPARKIARLLLSYRHRKVAFISPYHQYTWSRRRLEGLVAVYEESGITDGVVPFVRQTNDDPAGRVHAELLSLIERVLTESIALGITAWVTVNDQTAFAALELLARRGVSVPGDISVVSFDNTVDSLRLNLTSYDFNAAGLAMAMLGYILGRKPFTDRMTGTREIEGFVAERKSIGSARSVGSGFGPGPVR